MEEEVSVAERKYEDLTTLKDLEAKLELAKQQVRRPPAGRPTLTLPLIVLILPYP